MRVVLFMFSRHGGNEMKRIIPILIATILGFIFCINPKAEEDEPYKVYVTAYILKGTTATGIKTRVGIAAMNEENLGRLAILYKTNPDGTKGDIYGYYEIEDTGATKGLKNGSVIDIWAPTLAEAKKIMKETGGVGYVEIIDAEG